jgi:hypothetical protein
VYFRCLAVAGNRRTIDGKDDHMAQSPPLVLLRKGASRQCYVGPSIRSLRYYASSDLEIAGFTSWAAMKRQGISPICMLNGQANSFSSSRFRIRHRHDVGRFSEGFEAPRRHIRRGRLASRCSQPIQAAPSSRAAPSACIN